MRYLTAHFTIEELSLSQWASRHGVDNTPSPAAVGALEQLCLHILEPLRSQLGRPIMVSSGYRSPRVNLTIGGAARSQHSLGEAADITVYDHPPLDVCDMVVRLALPFDQLILEFDQWTHVSYGPRNRRQVLRASRSGGATVYSDLALG